MLSKGEQKLLAWYAVITMTSLLVNTFAQGPMPNCYDYTDDPCTTTCIGCTYLVGTDTFKERCCCRPDWGCWANPLTYDSQVSRCTRRIAYCVIQIPGTDPPQYHSYQCCVEPRDNEATGFCYEVDGAPCCSPGLSTGQCP
jgi:hypothetical protein